MVHKTLCALLVLSWVVFSGVDILEDLTCERDTTLYNSSASRSPAAKKQVKLANDTLELANHHAPSLGKISENTDLDDIGYQTFLNAYLDSKAFRTQKERRVFLI